MPQDDHEAWLAAHTFYCARLKASLTESACEKNRALPSLGGKMDAPRPGESAKRVFKPIGCEGCLGRKWMQLQGEKTMPEQKPRRSCMECGMERGIIGRGLCGACYLRLKKLGELNAKYPVQKGGRKPPTKKNLTSAAPTEEVPPKTTMEAVKLDLNKYPDLVDQLLRAAAAEVRDLPGQIIWELKRAMAIPTLPPCAYYPQRKGAPHEG